MTCLFLFLLLIGLVESHLYGQAVAELPPELALPESDKGIPGAGPIQRADWFEPLWNKRRAEWASRLQRNHPCGGGWRGALHLQRRSSGS